MSDDLVSVDIKAFGPDPTVFDGIQRGLLRHAALKNWLRRGSAAVLAVEAVEPEDRKPARPRPPERFRATVFDYRENRTLLVNGSFDDPRVVEVEESGIQPIPSPDEFAAAVGILSEADDEAGAALQAGRMRAYRPMPPLVGDGQEGDGEHRMLAVGLVPVRGRKGHRIVGVDMIDRKVVRFADNAPPNAAAHNPICGLPDAGQATAAKGTAGQAWVTVKSGSTTLWRFLVVRPAASSGTNGSGIELRYVDYRGKRLLYRAHVPILNVNYDGNACGPYLDWQYQEGMLQADGRDVAPGFRLCPAPAQTILDTGNDTGNFLGVAIYVQGQEVVLVSEMEAGWYRYVSEWRLHADGTVKPRFGFGATTSSCVCTRHHHHAYWRLDFDIRTVGRNRVSEFNDPVLVGSSNWHVKRYETQRPRNYGRKRRWRVENLDTREAYDIVPGHDDGVATASPDWPFPQGDVWFTRWRPGELENGVVATGPPYEANIGNFVNGELIDGGDVVVWYGGHFSHDIAHDEPGEFGHVVGPDLRPVTW
jgi:hypothetical protein